MRQIVLFQQTPSQSDCLYTYKGQPGLLSLLRNGRLTYFAIGRLPQTALSTWFKLEVKNEGLRLWLQERMGSAESASGLVQFLMRKGLLDVVVDLQWVLTWRDWHKHQSKL